MHMVGTARSEILIDQIVDKFIGITHRVSPQCYFKMIGRVWSGKPLYHRGNPRTYARLAQYAHHFKHIRGILLPRHSDTQEHA